MSLESVVTRAWERQALWLWLLLPLSWLYGLLIMLRQVLYKTGVLSSYRAPIPVMVIGNITVGGSGKTPLIISLVEYLQQQGVRVGVISRGYGGDRAQMPTLVTKESLPSAVGDEPCLIVSLTSVPMSVCPNRKQAIETLLQTHPDLQLIIADDGLQHYALQRDIEWIVVDSARGFGNQQLLPTGFLREPVSRLKDATVIYHKKPEQVIDANNYLKDHLKNDLTKQLTMHLCPDVLSPLWFDAGNAQNSVPMAGSQVHAVSGIGYPQRFFDTLLGLGFDVIAHPYPDHYDFNLTDLLQYTDYPIVVTGKDAVKIRSLFLQAEAQQARATQWKVLASRLWVLPVTAALSDSCYQTLNEQLKTLSILVHDVNDQG